MAQTPRLFRSVANWVAARRVGCPAAAALTDTLRALTGPERRRVAVADCCGPVPVGGDLRWPATGCGAGVDVVVVAHAGPACPAVLARSAAGPQLFDVVDSYRPGALAAALAAPVDQAGLLAARARVLAGEVRALAHRRPELAGELGGLLADAPVAPAAPTAPAAPAGPVAVVGPDAAACERVAGIVRDAGLRLAGAGQPAATVVAVPGPGGFAPQDAEVLAGLAATSRLVCTAAPPAGAAGVVCPPGELAAHLRGRGAAAAEPGERAWRRAVAVVEKRRARVVEAAVSSALACPDPRAGLARLAALARRHQTVPPQAVATSAAGWAEALALGLPAGLGAGLACARVAGPAPAVACALAVAAGAVWLRVRAARRSLARGQVTALAARLRAGTVARVPGDPGGRWLRRRASGVTGVRRQ